MRSFAATLFLIWISGTLLGGGLAQEANHLILGGTGLTLLLLCFVHFIPCIQAKCLKR